MLSGLARGENFKKLRFTVLEGDCGRQQHCNLNGFEQREYARKVLSNALVSVSSGHLELEGRDIFTNLETRAGEDGREEHFFWR